MDNRPIGLFDSGVGGLTIFSEILKKFPNENIIYLGDTKQFPYGNKSKETIVELSKKNIEFLIEKGVKAVVIACGTASSQALEEVKHLYNIPIIGVIEPTVLSIVKEKDINRIGVIATTGTIRSNSWEREIHKYIEDIEVISKACPLLAQMAEEGWTNNEIARLTIKEYVKAFKGLEIDKLILGCTHYPMFKKLIQEELGDNVEIINIGTKVAKYLENILIERKEENNQEQNPTYEIYLTDMENEFLKVANEFLNIEIEIKKV